MTVENAKPAQRPKAPFSEKIRKMEQFAVRERYSISARNIRAGFRKHCQWEASLPVLRSNGYNRPFGLRHALTALQIWELNC
jgi:hypothetical protein